MQKKNFKLNLFLILSSIIFLIGINLYLDPLQLFRATKYAGGQDRNLNPGIARQYDYNTVIMGTSTSQNILKNKLDEAFNVNSVNLSMSGSTFYEYKRLLEVVLETGKAKNIIYGMDIFSYNTSSKEVRIPLEESIYRNEIVGKFKLLFNYQFLKTGIKKFIKIEVFNKNKYWLEKYGYWGDSYIYSKKNTLCFDKNYQWGAQNLGALKRFEKSKYSYEKMKSNFDELYTIMTKNQDVKFKIYYPPYSSLWWYFSEKYDSLDNILKFKIYVANKVKSSKNIEVYDIQQNFKITENLNNYKDMIHYGPMISDEIIKMLVKKEYKIDFENYTKIINDQKNKILEKKGEYFKMLKDKNI